MAEGPRTVSLLASYEVANARVLPRPLERTRTLFAVAGPAFSHITS
jgi:hypothetical protein